MRIIFMGTSSFAVRCGEALRRAGCELPFVVTAPDKPQGRGLRVRQSPVKEWALFHGLRVLQPENLRAPEFIAALRTCAPEIIAVVAFRILPKEIIAIASLGAFNVHASLLPRYRGAAPIQWALINGERETGVTTFFLREQVDAGDIILQTALAVGADETFGELEERLAQRAAAATVWTVEMIRNGAVAPVPQDSAHATTAPKIATETCRIRWENSAVAIHNLVRALSPAPGAWTTLHGGMFKIFRTAVERSQTFSGSSGTLSIVNGRLFAAAGDGAVEILEAQREGRARMPAAKLVQGRAVKGGEVLQ